jgi:REP element-mobilizing transposase RayT
MQLMGKHFKPEEATMPRTQRLIINDETAVYHVMSRTALDGFPLDDIEKDFMVDLIRHYSTLYFVEILGFCLMGNHFHLLVRMFPEYKFTDKDIKKRYADFYGEEEAFADGRIPYWRAKLSSLSEFMREIKVGFARFYNKRHNRRGYFWGDRFKSVIVENGETLINCLAYIDLNPLRAGLVELPEQYRWNSLGYHVQTRNRENFLSLNFGLKEFGVLDAEERLKLYRQYVYEAGAVDRSEKRSADVIDSSVLKRERKNDFEIKRVQRFRYRTRYFTDSGIIGTKEFVSGNYRRFKDLFMSKRDKIPKPVAGLDGIFSLKRLAEG